MVFENMVEEERKKEIELMESRRRYSKSQISTNNELKKYKDRHLMKDMMNENEIR